jgi:VWFA-related protein
MGDTMTAGSAYGVRAAAAFLLTGTALAGVVTVGAFQDQAQRPVFRTGIDVIQVDVSVLDKQRRPVRGLTAEDFVVLENGVPQAVVGFVPIDVPEPDPIAAAWQREVTPDVQSNDLRDGRLFAIVMDDATIPPDPHLIRRARAIAREVVERLGPDDLAAVIFTRDNRHAVDFTRDRARLLAGIDRMSGGFAYAGQRTNDDHYWFFSSIRTLGQVSSYLRTVPQRRKAIVYVSTGVPVDPEAAAEAVAIGGPIAELAEHDLATELVQNTQETFTTVLQDTFLRAQHGNVNIYAIDPSGVGGLNFYFQSQTILPADAFVAGSSQRGMVAGLQLSRLNQDFLQTVAEQSGGRAVVNTNTFDEGIAQIFRENSSYYLVGYQSTRPPGDRTIRRVEVRVDRPDVEVRTRSAYFDQERAVLPPDAAPDLRLTNTLSGILPSPDIPMQATAAAFARPDRSAATVAVTIGLRQPAPVASAAEVPETIDLLSSAFTADGRPRGSQRKTVRLIARTGEPLIYDLVTTMELEPGRYQLRLAAESALLDKSGSVYVELEVPDFRREPLSLSGVVVSMAGGSPSLPPGAIEAIATLDPTSQREFGTADQVRLFARVYQGGSGPPRAAELNIRVTDARGTVVSRTTEALDPARFGQTRAADISFPLPLSRLQPGPYLVTIEVSRGGRSAAREVVFEVR